MADEMLRLNCYDKQSGFKPRPVEKPKPAAQPLSKELKVADEITPKGIGSDPASISFAKRDGEEFSVIKAAITWQPDFSPFRGTILGQYGWGPYLGFSINRNSLSTKRSDIQSVSTGLNGTILNPDVHGFGFFSKIGYTYREDDVEPSRTDVLVFDSILVADSLRYGRPTEGSVAWYLFPRGGLAYEDKRRAKAGDPTGSRTGAFLGMKGDLYPGFLTDRIKLSTQLQRYVDTSASGGLSKREENYAKLSIDYVFYAPLDDPAVKPSIGLERASGADPLNGIPSAGTTHLMLRLKIN